MLSCAARSFDTSHTIESPPQTIESTAIANLITDLRSQDARVRDTAEAKLVELGESILPFLDGVSSDPDPEVNGRIAAIRARLQWQEWIYWTGASARDLRSGRIIWTADNGCSIATQLGVFAHLTNGAVERRLLKDGQIVWRVMTEPPQVQLEATAQVLIVNGVFLRAIEIDSGKILWTMETEGSAWVKAWTNYLLISTGGSLSLCALATGKIVWHLSKGSGREIGFLPSGDIVALSQGVLSRYRLQDGSPVWSVEATNRRYPPTFAGDYVLVENRILDAGSGRTLVTFEQSPVNMIQSSDGKRLYVQWRGRVDAIDPTTAGTLWTRAYPTFLPDALVSVAWSLEGKRLYVSDLQLQCLDVDNGDVLWSSPLSDVNTPPRVISRIALRKNLVVVQRQALAVEWGGVFFKKSGIQNYAWTTAQ